MSVTTNTASSCRTAMDNLGIFLKSYTMSDQWLESLFDKTFDRTIRLDLNGHSYKRDFLIYQETRNFARRLRVENIVIEFLDHETFHYTYDVDPCCDDHPCSSSTAAAAPSSTFHSLATVKHGKISKIKPMTGSAYVELFEFNINYVMDDKAEVEAVSVSVSVRQQLPPTTATTTTTTTKLSTIRKRTTMKTPFMLTATNNSRRKRNPPIGEQQQLGRSSISLCFIHRVSGLFLSRRIGSNNSSRKVLATTE